MTDKKGKLKKYKHLTPAQKIDATSRGLRLGYACMEINKLQYRVLGNDIIGIRDNHTTGQGA